ncbi:MAG: GMC family oxidoreductase [Pyrinomonadaceae bacterium]|nr:GMC family oxidoreductase [Pyrinomonadaceae bacterium]
MPRTTCRLCGECDIGCNYGSKNTLDFNYISAAIHQTTPADVRTLCEVRSFEPNREGTRRYRVEYLIHDPEKCGEPGYEAETKEVFCDHLILSAGTFGTQYLLSKNKQSFPGISKTLGSRYSVNGDLLSFVMKAIERKNGKTVPRRLDPSFGPVITSALRYGDTLDGEGEKGRGFYIEDGGHPNLISWATEISGLYGYLKRSVKFLKIILKYRIGFSRDADLGAEISGLIGEATSAMSSMPMLAMGRDIASGNLFLRDDKYLDCDWRIKESAGYYDRVRRAGKAIAQALGAEYSDNPSYRWNFKQVLTAHPIGGCAMGVDDKDGVVSGCGEVFGAKGLYVADGSVMPGPVGPNPSLTIAALSNRFAEHIIADHKGANHECTDGK